MSWNESFFASTLDPAANTSRVLFCVRCSGRVTHVVWAPKTTVRPEDESSAACIASVQSAGSGHTAQQTGALQTPLGAAGTHAGGGGGGAW